MEIIVDEVNRLNTVVSQFLDYSRPLRPALAPTDLNEVLTRTFKLLQPEVPEAVTVSLQLADGLPRVQADAEQLKQVFLNLALNAFQAMPHGGRLVVSTYAARDDLAFWRDGGRRPDVVEIRFRDSGAGIADDAREAIFVPFYTTKEKGTGLGLAICQRIVKAHQGFDRGPLHPGRGSRVHHRPPRPAGGPPLRPRPPRRRGARPGAGAAPGGCRGPPAQAAGPPPGLMRPTPSRANYPTVAHVLIVDDEVNIRRVLAAMLKREGYEATASADGEQALAVLAKTPVDVVVTDLVMPRMGGMDLLKRVSADFPDVPVIVITAHGSVDSAVAALKAGAFDYITKPFEQEELKKVIAKATRAHDLERQNVHAPRRRGQATAGGRVGLDEGRCTRWSPGWPTPPPPCSSPARAAPARSSSRRRCTRARCRRDKPLHQGQLRRHPAGTRWRASSSATSAGAFTGAVGAQARPLRARRHAARCSSTRLARCRWRCR